ncbi:MAG: hypothetical protein R2726_19125 [Acidimicrobiales bacterium]
MVEPPGPNEIRLAIDAGEGAEVSPEAHEALERLMGELLGNDTAGFMFSLPGAAPKCVPFSCNGNGPCKVYSVTTCAIKTSCRIAD